MSDRRLAAALLSDEVIEAVTATKCPSNCRERAPMIWQRRFDETKRTAESLLDAANSRLAPAPGEVLGREGAVELERVELEILNMRAFELGANSVASALRMGEAAADSRMRHMVERGLLERARLNYRVTAKGEAARTAANPSSTTRGGDRG